MCVLSAQPGRAAARADDGAVHQVDTALVGDVAPGDWLLVFLDSARERLTPERAQEISATLALVRQALAGHEADGAAAFALPSAMSAADVLALTRS